MFRRPQTIATDTWIL